MGAKSNTFPFLSLGRRDPAEQPRARAGELLRDHAGDATSGRQADTTKPGFLCGHCDVVMYDVVIVAVSLDRWGPLSADRGPRPPFLRLSLSLSRSLLPDSCSLFSDRD